MFEKKLRRSPVNVNPEQLLIPKQLDPATMSHNLFLWAELSDLYLQLRLSKLARNLSSSAQKKLFQDISEFNDKQWSPRNS
ncbi:hypothetical protein ACFL27_13600 [candidate division CSSED10-310 bacterium]|uniref:Uncharacterized protein n=1 Tax=candidate division CSSED10-310 bacterium TaxID=2855610 RepID=A0ABV6YYF3_UNCC1